MSFLSVGGYHEDEPVHRYMVLAVGIVCSILPVLFVDSFCVFLSGLSCLSSRRVDAVFR